jgi:hypothetical protein
MPMRLPRIIIGFKRTLLLAFLLSLVGGWSVYGQTNGRVVPHKPFYYPVSIGLIVGTKALAGIDVTLALSPKTNLKLGFNYLKLAVRDFEINTGKILNGRAGDIDQFNVFIGIDVDINQNNLELLMERSVFKDKLRIVFGMGYFFKNTLSGKIQLRDNLRFNDIDFTPEEIGFAKGSISFKSPFSPFVGLAIGNAIPKKRVGFSVNVGTFYKGKPQLNIEATNLVRNNGENEKIIEDGLSSYMWWPVLSFRLAYNLFHP